MKQIAMDGDTPVLPQDIITNILKRLPVKSLIRFQCVCKYWRYLFKNPSFIADHLHHSTHQDPSLLYECARERRSLHLCLLDREMQVTELLNAPLIDSRLYVNFVSIVGSSNGLLCVELLGISESFILLNPATREIRPVPKALKCLVGQKFYEGFGFSSIVNDYKRVRISVFNAWFNKVEVYSLSTRSWKEVEFGKLDGVILQSSGFNINGAIFWYGLRKEGKNYGWWIVSFDIATKVLILIPMPAIECTLRTRFTMYEHKLAILHPYVIGNCESFLFELWVMEEGTSASGEKWSWTKKYTSSCPYPCSLRPVTIWRNELVCTTGPEVENDEIKTVMCNLATNELKMFDTCRCSRSYGFFNYAESLVPVDRRHIEEP